MNLDALQRIKRWHVAHQREHPVECQAWDVMLTLWLASWVGWIPAFFLDAVWLAPVLAVGMSAPKIYVTWRTRAHRARRLRCDWLLAVG